VTAHVPSDDRAILAAHDQRLWNAGVSLDRAVAAFKLKARREFLERVIQALKGYHDEYVAGLERKEGREPGSFGRIDEDLRRAEAVAEAWAGIDGKADEFALCRANRDCDDTMGHYGGYVAEARELIRRIEARGYTVTALTAEPYPPQIRPPAVEPWEDGPRPRPQNDFGRGAP
jgi:hypothetical protein